MQNIKNLKKTPLRSLLQTERLTLRHFTPEDAGFIVKLVNTTGWIRYIGDISIHNETQAERYITDGPAKSFETHGFSSYRISLSSNNTPVGMCSLIKRDWLNSPDLGYALLPEFERNGYAFEAAGYCLQEMYNNQHTAQMNAIVSPDNARSIRLMEKLNFNLSGPVTRPGSTEELLLFTHKNGF